jgi:hypothetical protein
VRGWSTLLQKVTMISRSYQSQMRLVAFVQDSLEIKQSKNSLKFADFWAPPPIPKAPRITLQLDMMSDYEA